MKYKNKNLILQKNELTEACYSLTLPETRVLYLARYRVSRLPDGDKSKVVKISIYDYSKQFDCSLDDAGKDIRRAMKTLYEKDIRLVSKNKRIRWLQEIPLKFETGAYRLTFTDALFEFLNISLSHEKRFTKLFLTDAGRLDNPYAIKLLGLMRRHIRGWFRFYIEDLHDFLDVPLSYRKNFADIQRKIITKAIEDIAAAGFYTCTVIPLKKGRRVTEVMFQYYPVDFMS